MPVWVEGRGVYVNTQHTQTVKICTTKNTRGIYERYYRIAPPQVLGHEQMELTVTRFTTLSDLDRRLMVDRKASRESEKEVGSSSDVQPDSLPSAWPVFSVVRETDDERKSWTVTPGSTRQTSLR